MNHRYRASLALTSIMLLAAAPHPVRRPADPAALYSTRALRRARTLLQLKLLELRKAHLERVRKAIEKGIPVDRLLRDGEVPNRRSARKP